MRRVRIEGTWKTLALAGAALLLIPLSATSREPFVDHGGAELAVPGPVQTPIRHQPLWVDERDQFGYNPRYPARPVTFGPDNRPYIWDSVDLITLTDDGRWEAPWVSSRPSRRSTLI